MRAVQFPRYAAPLEVVELPAPVPGPGQVLVRGVFASVNPVDWKQASGTMRWILPADLPCIPGRDLSGEVVAVGEGVTGFAPGARVHAHLPGRNGGACAEQVVVAAESLVPMPEGMSFETAAGLPLAGETALQALRDVGGLPLQNASARVLVVGASGGVGHLAVQIARAAGAQVTGVCSGRNAARVKELGAHEVLDYTRPGAFDGQRGFDLVIDCVGSDHGSWLPLLGPKGGYVCCTPGAGTFLRSALNPLVGRSVRPIMLSSRPADLRLLDGLCAAGRLRVLVDGQFPLAKLGDAWERSRSGRAVGKILVDLRR